MHFQLTIDLTIVQLSGFLGSDRETKLADALPLCGNWYTIGDAIPGPEDSICTPMVVRPAPTALTCGHMGQVKSQFPRHVHRVCLCICGNAVHADCRRAFTQWKEACPQGSLGVWFTASRSYYKPLARTAPCRQKPLFSSGSCVCFCLPVVLASAHLHVPTSTLCLKIADASAIPAIRRRIQVSENTHYICSGEFPLSVMRVFASLCFKYHTIVHCAYRGKKDHEVISIPASSPSPITATARSLHFF